MPIVLTPGGVHRDVKRAKRLLKRWLNAHGHKPMAAAINQHHSVYGEAMRRGVVLFQRENGLKPDAVVGPKTWAALGVKPPKPSKRALMKRWMNVWLHHEASVHYRQSRPMPLRAMKRLQFPVWTDCSGSTTGCHYYAGCGDPNGRKYDGSGYTGTMRNHGPRTTLANAQVGDYIIYGRGTGSHVVMVYEPHATNPLVFSHGQESGPRLYRHSVQVAAHGGYFTVHKAIV